MIQVIPQRLRSGTRESNDMLHYDTAAHSYQHPISNRYHRSEGTLIIARTTGHSYWRCVEVLKYNTGKVTVQLEVCTLSWNLPIQYSSASATGSAIIPYDSLSHTVLGRDSMRFVRAFNIALSL